MKKIVIVGATSAMAEHCARLWLQQQPLDLVLLGRNLERLDRVATDLRVRSPASAIRTLSVDLLDPTAIAATIARIWAAGEIDVALIAHGWLPSQAECENDLLACEQTLRINGVSPVLYAEALAKHMAQAQRGTIALIGSVAGDRGRRSNYVYGAAKGLVTRYAQGLQHRFAGTGVRVVLIKPGPTDTPMTAHLKAQGARLAAVDSVARQIVAGIDAGQAVVYSPGVWRLIMAIVRHLPAFLFNKTKL